MKLIYNRVLKFSGLKLEGKASIPFWSISQEYGFLEKVHSSPVVVLLLDSTVKFIGI